ncbi:MAG: HAMP domain-containing sensor histidine kinase [Lachnospiraceae bacterium]|nr:HAMP domain-containing sensor histidine kinase [Lachnospiraceae bacterium]
MQKCTILKYIQAKKHHLTMFFVCVAIYAALFALCEVPLKYVWYPSLLCLVFLVVYGAIRYQVFRGTHKQLFEVKEHIDVTTANLPEANNLLEADYQTLLEVMNAAKNEALQEQLQKNHDMDAYVTLWSHQIKTPLTALQLTAQTADEPMKTELGTQIFEIEQYVNMMLQYLRLQDMSADMVIHSYSLRSMANQAVKYFARIFLAKKISVQVDIPEELKVVTDEKWFVFVLKQLVSNALKYSDEGSIFIRATSQGGGRHSKTTVIVEDTGIGIAKEDLPRIFERGYTGYNGRKDKKATGLGLYLTRRVLLMLGHTIEITSEVGVGTKVLITIEK